MTTIEECINLITDLYERFYGNTDELKEKFINQYYFSSNEKKNSLVTRFQIDYDFLLSVPDRLGIEKDDYRLKEINEYCEYFKYSTILLGNNVYNWDFCSPNDLELTFPHKIEEARMYLFDTSSPKEANEKMSVLWQQKKELQKNEIYSEDFNKSCKNSVVMIDISMIEAADKFMEDKYFEGLDEEADSIKKYGIIEPILVKKSGEC